MTAGIINVLKPPGMTSHDVVSFIRRTFGLKKVGHAGTLDPAAAGVLPVFLGNATRLIEYSTEAEKSYRAELTFGYATDTGDDTGKIIKTASEPCFPAVDNIAAAFKALTGEIEQVPPMYSAIKIEGVRLYELARKGVEITRPSRKVFISSIELVNMEPPAILFDVTCSKGTYIRTLCADIGEKAGCPAVMSFLVRTRVGSFTISEALTLEEISELKEKALLPADYAIKFMPEIILDDSVAKAFGNGLGIKQDLLPQSNFYRVYNREKVFIGIGEKNFSNNWLYPIKVFK